MFVLQSALSTRILNRIYRNRYLCSTCTRSLFWEPYRKGGYNTDLPQLSNWQHMKNGLKALKGEIELFKEEWTEKLRSDPFIIYPPGVIDKQWELREAKQLKDWILTSDSDHGEGFSSCSLEINSRGFGHFSGVLDTAVPKDGAIKRSGYCSMRTIRKRRSFQREGFHDWTPYTHLVIRVRGDGRSYMMNLATCGYFDQFWNDMFSYVLYTRGGPYWQVTKVPFSKFFFASKGRIQDIQSAIPLDRVTSFGITAADKVNGSFSLEIDYIGLEYDPTHEEEFAYEMYQLPRYLART